MCAAVATCRVCAARGGDVLAGNKLVEFDGGSGTLEFTSPYSLSSFLNPVYNESIIADSGGSVWGAGVLHPSF